MKKKISVFLCMILVIMSMAACQGGKPTPSGEKEPKSETGKTETGKTETEKVETGKTETQKPDEAKPEEKKPDAAGKTKIEGNLRFMWWGGETRHKATVEAVDTFIKKNPDLKVAYEYSGFDGYFDKLLTQMAGNNAPDIVQLSFAAVNEYITRGQLQPLNEFIDNGTLDVSNIDKTLLDTYKVNGNYYAIPTGVNTLFLFYNKTLFDKYGIEHPTTGMTMDEVYAKAKQITEAARAAGDKNVWGMSMTTGAIETVFQRNVIDSGGKLWQDDLSAAAFNSEAGAAALAYIKKPLEEGYGVPLEVSAGNPAGVSSFGMGYAAMEITNSTATAGYAASSDFELGIALAPFGNHHKVTWYQPSQVFCITSQSSNPQAAASIINYLINDDEAAGILRFERGIPANSKIREKAKEGKSDWEKLQLDLVNEAGKYTGDGTPMGYPMGFLEILNEYVRQEEAYMYGKISAQEMLDNLEKFANDTISKF
ncbi:sugar ABC transporter substrate-binding protein [Clostridiales bacterium COT073_COT-073]|nr:sugar ABC transporter substrate-binding protein [Clostridiales bacterium COT073_COT-073]